LEVRTREGEQYVARIKALDLRMEQVSTVTFDHDC